MSALIRVGDNVFGPVVTARATMPLPALPGRESGEVVEMELLTITGPPDVVGVAMSALDDYVDDLAPTIAALYDDNQPPQGG